MLKWMLHKIICVEQSTFLIYLWCKYFHRHLKFVVVVVVVKKMAETSKIHQKVDQQTSPEQTPQVHLRPVACTTNLTTAVIDDSRGVSYDCNGLTTL
jgi:hypothetical protein